MFWGWYIAIGFIILANFILAMAAFTNRKLIELCQMVGLMVFIFVIIFAFCLIVHFLT